MKNLLLFLLISATLHFLFIVFMPSFAVVLDYDEPEPIYVEIVATEKQPDRPMLEPERSAEPDPTVKLNETPKPEATVNKVERKIEKPITPSGADKPLILPDVALPKSAVETVKQIALPDIDDIPDKPNPDVFKGPDLDRELKSLDTARRGGAVSDRDVASNSNASVGNDIGTEAFDFDVKPSNNRKVLYAPPSPEFSLVANTKIKVKFSIDRSGATRNVQFVTRSEPKVEELARDYVSKLRFNSVAYDEMDTTQITLTFKVKK